MIHAACCILSIFDNINPLYDEALYTREWCYTGPGEQSLIDGLVDCVILSGAPIY